MRWAAPTRSRSCSADCCTGREPEANSLGGTPQSITSIGFPLATVQACFCDRFVLVHREHCWKYRKVCMLKP